MSRTDFNEPKKAPGNGLTPSAERYISAVKKTMAEGAVSLNEIPIEAYRNMCDSYANQSGSFAPGIISSTIELSIGDGVSLLTKIFDIEGEESDRKPVLIWIPGGGFIAYLKGCHDSSCSIIAANSGYRVMLVHPRLAPEFKAPIPLEDVCAAVIAIYTQAADFHIDPDHIVLGGDSSGANLSLGCAIRFRDSLAAGKEAPVLSELILLSGTYDLTLSVRTPEITVYEKEDFMGDESFEYMFSHYLPKDMLRSHPEVSPWFHDLHGLPEMFLIVAEYDGVRSQSDALHQRLLQKNIMHRYCMVAGQTHSFFLLRGVMPDGDNPADIIAENLCNNHYQRLTSKI